MKKLITTILALSLLSAFSMSCNKGFNFYDLALDVETKLRVYPFAYMDVALKNGLNLSCQSAWETIQRLTDEVVMVNGEMISIWHNESLSDEFEWKGWRSVYEKSLDYASVIDKVPYSR